VREVLDQRIAAWIADEDSAVEYSEELEGRIAVRMSQQARDATTVWFEVGTRSLWFEAYVLPVPEGGTRVYRQALRRNAGAWRTFFALDDDDGLVLRGRLPAERVTSEELDRVLGEIYEMIEVAFRSLVRDAFGNREKSG
jgi:hypothetical protein